MNSGLVFWDWIGTLTKSRTNSREFFPDALPSVELLDGAYIQAIVSKAKNPEEREKQILESPFAKYMLEIKAVREKTPEVFREIMEKQGFSSKNIWFIDDRARTGIKTGNQLGCKTIWLKRLEGEYLHETPDINTGQPYKTISSLNELTSILLL